MSDLAQFLLARIDEDEDAARRAAFGYGAGWTSVSDDVDDWSAVHADGKRDMVGCEDRDVTRHIARHDPARVLAECASKRRIVERWRATDEAANRKNATEYYGSAHGLMWAIKALALPYADHADHQPEWKP